MREGDSVQSGQVIAILDDEQVRAREEAAKSALLQSEAKAKSARDQTAVLGEQLQQEQANVAQQEASYKFAAFDEEAYTRLAKAGAVSERQGKQAATTAEQQRAAVLVAQRRVAGVRMQLAQQQADIASAEASIGQARAQLAEAQANRQDLTVKAPFSGTIATRAAEPGEVVRREPPWLPWWISAKSICAASSRRADRQSEGGAGGPRISGFQSATAASAPTSRASIPRRRLPRKIPISARTASSRWWE